MERHFIEELVKWKNSKYRKPLIVRGIRQVGKTWVLQEFGRRHYQHTAYFSFDEQKEFRRFFETTSDVRRIVQNLAMAGGFTILPAETLIIFDEIQECPAAIAALKYFCENAPEYHVACAGSLLGVALGDTEERSQWSFPVGKVDFLDLYPMNFTEFLGANGDENLAAYDDIDAFKVYLPDVGLLRRLARLAPSVFAEENRLFVEFKGALSENYVLQALAGQFEGIPRYWARDNPRYEVDFIVQWQNEIIPVEVKSEENVESRSLKKYLEQYEKTPLGIRFSLKNVRLDGRILNIPLFLADRTESLIKCVLEKK